MTVAESPVPQSRAAELLDRHGIRYEVVNGEIIISPSPSQLHQEIQLDILLQARHNGYPATMDASVVFPGTDDELRPDVAVYEEGTELPRTGMRPGHTILLAVEVVSPASRIMDEFGKKERYAALGVPSYMVIRQSGDLWTLHSSPEEGKYTQLTEGPMGDFAHVPSLPWAVRTRSLDRYM